MSSPTAARPPVLPALLLAALPACGVRRGSAPDDGIPGPVVTIDASLPHEGPWDPWRLAVEEGARARPLDATQRRPLACLEVLDVDRLLVQGDRGPEVVRVEGLGGRDPALPAELDHWLAEEARPRAAAWLDAPGTRLFERVPPLFHPRGWAAGPSLHDPDGLRFVVIERRDAEGVDEDYRLAALANGWAYTANAYWDDLALDPRFPFTTPESEAGLFALPCVKELSQSYAAEAEALAAIDADSLQERGVRLLADLAPTLGWEPAVVPTFVPVTPAEAEAPFLTVLAAERERVHAYAEGVARDLARAAGPDATYELRVDEPPLEVSVAALIARVHGFSPQGERIWILRKPVSEPLFDDVLVHELVHQYQEEVVSPDGGIPMLGLPLELAEAHAEWLSMRWRAERAPGAPNRPIDYRVSVRLFDWLVTHEGFTPEDVLAHFFEKDWSVERWNDLRNGELSLQEWRLIELAESDWEGLRFEAVERPEDGAGVPVVRVQNGAATPFDGQFHGVWWRVYTLPGEEGEHLSDLQGAPFNLRLPAGASVELRLAEDPLWVEGRTERVTGLLSRTTRLADDGQRSGDGDRAGASR